MYCPQELPDIDLLSLVITCNVMFTGNGRIKSVKRALCSGLWYYFLTYMQQNNTINLISCSLRSVVINNRFLILDVYVLEKNQSSSRSTLSALILVTGRKLTSRCSYVWTVTQHGCIPKCPKRYKQVWIILMEMAECFLPHRFATQEE